MKYTSIFSLCMLVLISTTVHAEVMSFTIRHRVTGAPIAVTADLYQPGAEICLEGQIFQPADQSPPVVFLHEGKVYGLEFYVTGLVGIVAQNNQGDSFPFYSDHVRLVVPEAKARVVNPAPTGWIYDRSRVCGRIRFPTHPAEAHRSVVLELP